MEPFLLYQTLACKLQLSHLKWLSRIGCSVAIPGRRIVRVELVLQIQKLLSLHRNFLVSQLSCLVLLLESGKGAQIILRYLCSSCNSSPILLFLRCSISQPGQLFLSRCPSLVLRLALFEQANDIPDYCSNDRDSIHEKVDHCDGYDQLSDIVELLFVINKVACEEAQQCEREKLDNLVYALITLVVSICQGPDPEDDHSLGQAQCQRKHYLQLRALVQTQDKYDQRYATNIGPCNECYKALS